MSVKLSRLLTDLDIEWQDLSTSLHTLRNLYVEYPHHVQEIENILMDFNKRIAKMRLDAISKIERLRLLDRNY